MYIFIYYHCMCILYYRMLDNYVISISICYFGEEGVTPNLPTNIVPTNIA